MGVNLFKLEEMGSKSQEDYRRMAGSVVRTHDVPRPVISPRAGSNQRPPRENAGIALLPAQRHWRCAGSKRGS